MLMVTFRPRSVERLDPLHCPTAGARDTLTDALVSWGGRQDLGAPGLSADPASVGVRLNAGPMSLLWIPSPWMGEGQGAGEEPVDARPPTPTLPHEGGGRRISWRRVLAASHWFHRRVVGGGHPRSQDAPGTGRLQQRGC